MSDTLALPALAVRMGPAERALHAAIGEVNEAGGAVPCQLVPWFWGSDRGVDREFAADECGGCSVLSACARAAAELRPSWGVWAGIDAGRTS